VAFLNGSLSHALSLARLSFRLPQLFTPTLYRRLELPLPQQRLTWPLEARDGRAVIFDMDGTLSIFMRRRGGTHFETLVMTLNSKRFATKSAKVGSAFAGFSNAGTNRRQKGL